jgi:hypothetical protein
MVAAISTPHVPGNRLPSLSFILNRQWALKTFNLWGPELAFIEKCIETDVRNNSAWNQVDPLVFFRTVHLARRLSDREWLCVFVCCVSLGSMLFVAMLWVLRNTTWLLNT